MKRTRKKEPHRAIKTLKPGTIFRLCDGESKRWGYDKQTIRNRLYLLCGVWGKDDGRDSHIGLPLVVNFDSQGMFHDDLTGPPYPWNIGDFPFVVVVVEPKD